METLSMLRGILLPSLLPVVATVAGGGIAALLPPSAKIRSYIQHFAAGVVFSVVSVELLPDIVKRHLPWEVAIGFASGVAVMLSLKTMTTKLQGSAERGFAGLIAGVAIDILLDGVLIGIGFSAGEKEGLLLTLALTVELLSLGLAMAASFGKAGVPRGRIVLIIFGLSLLILPGSAAGAILLRLASAEILEVILSFGLAALLFLVTEELLVEAHEEPETPIAAAMFFMGFLLFVIIGMVS